MIGFISRSLQIAEGYTGVPGYQVLGAKQSFDFSSHSKRTPTYLWSIPTDSLSHPQMKGIPNHKLLVGGSLGLFPRVCWKILRVIGSSHMVFGRLYQLYHFLVFLVGIFPGDGSFFFWVWTYQPRFFLWGRWSFSFTTWRYALNSAGIHFRRLTYIQSNSHVFSCNIWIYLKTKYTYAESDQHLLYRRIANKKHTPKTYKVGPYYF